MGLFRCKYCDRVYSTESQSSKRNLCQNCYMKLEDLYSRSGIHDYIRDHGLEKNFDIEKFAREIGMNPRNVKILYDLGFFDRDIQVYGNSYNSDKKKLVEQFKGEIEKLKHKDEPEKNEFHDSRQRTKSKFVSYGGRLYNRRTF